MITPLLMSDFPEPDVIRVGDTYYMLCTTKHFIPGGVILKSYDLMNWEIISHLFDRLESTPRQTMQGEQSFYGHGMDGGCLRYHNGLFYACFCSGDMNYAYLYTAEHAEGPWNVHRINQEIYGCSILFDDDGRVYIVYGYKNIYLQEMKPDLSDFLEGGLFKKILTTDEPAYVYYNGSHIHKINGRYYISVMNWPKKGNALRTQYCFWSDTIDGEFTGGVVMCTDNGYNYQGIAGGGFVDTPEGDWYSVLFQDRGAVGRMPVLVPVSFKNGAPVFAGGKKFIPEFTVRSTRPDYMYEPVVTSDNFDYAKDDIGRYILKKQWKWNHEPADKLWWINDIGGFCIKTGKISTNLIQARNTLTQRCIQPYTDVSVELNADSMKDGDCAGLCLLQGCYGYIGVTKELNRYYLVVVTRSIDENSIAEVLPDYMPGTMQERMLLEGTVVKLRIKADFDDMVDTAQFFYEKDGEYVQVGGKHNLYYKVDHFTGCRVGLFNFATREIGGHAEFNRFRYRMSSVGKA